MSRALAAALTVGAGVLVAMQAPVNSKLGRTLGTFQASSLSFLIGLLILVAIALATGGFGSVAHAGRQPWWYYLGGLFGAAYVTTVLVSVRSLGAAGVTAATIAGQLAMAVVIDRFGLLGVARHPVTLARVGGLVLLAAGAALVVRG